MANTLYIKQFNGHSKATTSLIEKDSVLRVRKEVRGRSVDELFSLERQFNWLQKLPAQSQPYFPKVFDYYKSSLYFSYDMSFYNLPSLSDLWLSGLVSYDELLVILSDVLSIYFQSVYPASDEPSHDGHVLDFIRNTTLPRISQTEDMSDEFKRFNSYDTFLLNGQRIRNARYILTKILQNHKAFEPVSFGRAHGDLSLANILSDSKQIILIDPRGDTHNTYLYDLGKLYTSCIELWEVIKEKEIDIRIHQNSLTSNVSSSTNAVVDQEKQEELLWNFFEKHIPIEKEPKWKDKILLFAGLQLIGNCTFTLHRRGLKYTILTYLTGLKILERLL